MLDKLLQLVGTVAPILGTVLGSPLAGTAIALISQKLFGNSAASVTDILNSLKNDPNQIIKLKEIEADLVKHQSDNDLAMATLDANIAQSQIKVNEVAAGSNIFNSGWRSAIGWMGVIALFSQLLLTPYLAAFHVVIPSVDIQLLYGLLTILIGARSVDKIKGVK